MSTICSKRGVSMTRRFCGVTSGAAVTAELLVSFFWVTGGLGAVCTSDRTVAAGFRGYRALVVLLEVELGKFISTGFLTRPLAAEVDGVALTGCLRPRLGSPLSASGWSTSKRTFLILGALGVGEGDLDGCPDGLRSTLPLWRCGDRAPRREEVEDSEVSLSELVDTYSFDLKC